MMELSKTRAQLANNLKHWERSRISNEEVKAKADEDLASLEVDLTVSVILSRPHEC